MMDFLLDDTKKRPGKNPEPLFLRLLPLAQVVVHLLVLLVVLGLRLPHPVIAALQGHQLVVAADFPDAAGPSAEILKRGAGAKSDDLLPRGRSPLANPLAAHGRGKILFIKKIRRPRDLGKLPAALPPVGEKPLHLPPEGGAVVVM